MVIGLKKVTKSEIMKLFSVENKKSYQTNTARFKQSVLDIAVKELNKYTELEVWYTEEKSGNKIKGFTLHWSSGKRLAGVTDKQVSLIRMIHDEVEGKIFNYLGLENMKDLKLARINILKVKEINEQVNEQLTSDQAKDLIWDLKIAYKQLENLLKKDSQKEDDLLKFNWLED